MPQEEINDQENTPSVSTQIENESMVDDEGEAEVVIDEPEEENNFQEIAQNNEVGLPENQFQEQSEEPETFRGHREQEDPLSLFAKLSNFIVSTTGSVLNKSSDFFDGEAMLKAIRKINKKVESFELKQDLQGILSSAEEIILDKWKEIMVN